MKENHVLGTAFSRFHVCSLVPRHWSCPKKRLAFAGDFLGWHFHVDHADLFFRPSLRVGRDWLFLPFFWDLSPLLFLLRRAAWVVHARRIYGLVNLYLLLGMFYFAVFNFIETVEPGSFRETALPALDGIFSDILLYLSLVTLTTLVTGT